jgi:hypothetical protein
MAEPVSLAHVTELAAQLSAAEQKQLANALLAGLGSARQAANGLAWSRLRGRMPYPAFGEDAQTWVSRTREETDEHRGRPLKEEP